MEPSNTLHNKDVERKCQVEGCIEFTVGGRATLCRKHRNNKYKQNYKKKKRKAAGIEENQCDVENQQAGEKIIQEQRYASMLEQVLIAKRLELLQSESVIQILKRHQWKVRQMKVKEMEDKKKIIESEEKEQQQQQQQQQPKQKLHQQKQQQQQQQISKFQRATSPSSKLVCGKNSSLASGLHRTPAAVLTKQSRKQNPTESPRAVSAKTNNSKTNPVPVVGITVVNPGLPSAAVTAALVSSNRTCQSQSTITNSSSVALDSLPSQNLIVSCASGTSTIGNLLTASHMAGFNRYISNVTQNTLGYQLGQSQIITQENVQACRQGGHISYPPITMAKSTSNTRIVKNTSSDPPVSTRSAVSVTCNQLSGRFQAIAPATLSSSLSTRPQTVTMATTIPCSKTGTIQGRPLSHLAPKMPFDVWTGGVTPVHSKVLTAPTQQKLVDSMRQELPQALMEFAVPQRVPSCNNIPHPSNVINMNSQPGSFAQLPEMQQMRTPAHFGSNFVLSQTGQMVPSSWTDHQASCSDEFLLQVLQETREGAISMDTSESSATRGRMKGTTAHALDHFMAEAQWAMNIDI